MHFFMLESQSACPGQGGGGRLIECECVTGQSAVRDTHH